MLELFTQLIGFWWPTRFIYRFNTPSSPEEKFIHPTKTKDFTYRIYMTRIALKRIHLELFEKDIPAISSLQRIQPRLDTCIIPAFLGKQYVHDLCAVSAR